MVQDKKVQNTKSKRKNSKNGDKKDKQTSDTVTPVKKIDKEHKDQSEEDQKLQALLSDLVSKVIQTQNENEKTVSQIRTRSKSRSRSKSIEQEQQKLFTQRLQSLNQLKHEISNATTSMTSIPKPLKYLHIHYSDLKKFYSEHWKNVVMLNQEGQKLCADVLSCLAMTMAKSDSNEVLYFYLKGSRQDVGMQGFEYVRHLSAEIIHWFQQQNTDSKDEEQQEKLEEAPSTLIEDKVQVNMLLSDLNQIVEAITKYYMSHNSPEDACDLLIEVDRLEILVSMISAGSKLDSKELTSVSVNTVERICTYLLACSNYVADTEELQKMLTVVFELYLRCEKLCQALRVAIKIDDRQLMSLCFALSMDPDVTKQLAFIIGAHKLSLPIFEDDEDLSELIGNCKLNEHFLSLAKDLNVEEAKMPEDVYKSHLAVNSSTRRGRSNLASSSFPIVDSAKENLASTFVNAFVNAGFGKDSLMLPEESEQLYKNKDHGMLSATASLGMLLLQDLETGYSSIDRFSFSTQNQVKSGSLLASGIIASGVTSSEMDAAFALLSGHLEEGIQDVQMEEINTENSNSSATTYQMKVCATLGLGLAYAGTGRLDVLELLQPYVLDIDGPFELSSFAALSIGLVFVGSCNDEVCGIIIQTLMDRSTSPNNDLKQQSAVSSFLGLALALLYLGQGENADAVIEAVTIVEHDIIESIKLLITTFAQAGTGNVLQIQHLLSIAGEHPPSPDLKAMSSAESQAKVDEENTQSSTTSGLPNDNSKVPVIDDLEISASDSDSQMKVTGVEASGSSSSSKTAPLNDNEDQSNISSSAGNESYIFDKYNYQAIAVLGISLVAMGDSIGTEMALRSFDNLLQYGEIGVRRSVPLSLGLLYISDPNFGVMETLSKLTHDQDEHVSQNAIFALGLVGCGTNNARIAKMLRHLAVYYQKEPNHLFLTRISQGLIHMSKGLVSLNPFHSDSMLMSKTALAGILTVLISALDMKSTILSDKHYLLYFLVTAIRPRMLITLDQNLRPLPVDVRVGQAVETVKQAGRPKTITGFQTHTTPVLLAKGERAELASNQYIALSPVLEGFVLLKPNPDYVLDDDTNNIALNSNINTSVGILS